MVKAVLQLKPSAVNTVPWVVEGLSALVDANDADTTRALRSLQLLTYGGAALAPHCAATMRALGVTFACTYGQTELCGPVMFGRPRGDPDALLPLQADGFDFELVRGEADGRDEGELVLLGCQAATTGYLPLASDPRVYRSLTGGAQAITTRTRYYTGDRFRI
eukprot:4222862-Prymnesium_polylepis.1